MEALKTIRELLKCERATELETLVRREIWICPLVRVAQELNSVFPSV